jgi:MATE family multidrug resistance protein
MAGPLFLQNLLAYSTSVVAVAFIGHLDDPSLLSSAVLANSLFNVSGYSVVQGLSAGMETLCGQVSSGYIASNLLLAHVVGAATSRPVKAAAVTQQSCGSFCHS